MTGRGRFRYWSLPLAAILVAVVAVAAVGAVPFDDGPPDGETVLNRSAQQYAAADTVVGDATVSVTAGNESVSRQHAFAFADGGRARVSVSADTYTYVVGTNGSVAWLQDERTDRVVAVELPENASFWIGNRSALAATDGSVWAGNETTLPGNHTATLGNRTLTLGNYNAFENHTAVGTWRNWHDGNGSHGIDGNLTAETVETTTLNGTEVYVVEVAHTNESASGTVTLWIGTEQYRVQKVQAAAADWQATATMDVRFNVSVYNTTFRPPESAASVTRYERATYERFSAAQANTSVLLGTPGDGYAFADATVTTRAGRTIAVQRYTDTATSSTVRVAATADSLPVAVNDSTATGTRANGTATNGTTVTVAGYDGTHITRDGRAAVIWEQNGVTRAVIADEPRAALVELAERVAGSVDDS